MSTAGSDADVHDLEPFDVCGPLPQGTTVLEASAGTGKTYTIAALAARYIAEGVATLDQLMLVTFGRMATNELRMRVRERLVGVERALAAVVADPAAQQVLDDPAAPQVLDDPVAPQVLDDVEALLCAGDVVTLTNRHRRIARALADFDAATIATTHEFCLRMLDGLGVLGDREPQAVFVEHLSELTREVTSDVYLRRYATQSQAPPLTYDDALDLAREVVDAQSLRLVPSGDGQSADTAAERVAFASEVRAEVRRRKELGRLFTYDDMLTRLRDALADPTYGEQAAERLRRRYAIVLVDEFQDTDPVQWDIVRRAFHSHATLILIGDPKQAIYAFRGADVLSYLDAVRTADHVRTLDRNWRSDAAVVRSVSTLAGGAALGDPRIVVRPVQARDEARRISSVTGGPGATAPLRLRVIAHHPELERLPSVTTLRPRIVADVVADVTAMLASDVQLKLDGEPNRSVSPGDVAVLVRKNERGEAIRDALTDAGVPAVLLGASSVFTSEMAAHWLTLLKALEQPRQTLVREASLTCFLGWSFDRLARAGEDELSDLSQRVRWWSRVLASSGVAALLEAIGDDTQLAERLLGQPAGERMLTDLRHVGQSLHAAMATGRLGVSALVDWLRERRDEAQANAHGDGTRRLETDARSVQILTIHRSKGLEFPVVYLPEAWDRFGGSDDKGWTLRSHETQPGAGDPHGSVPTGPSERVLDVGGVTGADRRERLTASRKEEAGEELRLLYVALTRAQCQIVAWWAPSRNTEASALHRFLEGPRRDGVEPDQTYPVTDDPFHLTHLGAEFSLERVEPRPAVAPPIPPPSEATLSVGQFDRDLDLVWRRTSYSALTAAVHGLDLSDPGVGSETDAVKEDDESHVAAVVPPAPANAESGHDPAWLAPSPMGQLPSGTQFGTAVHAILEAVDHGDDDLLGALRRAAAEQLGRAPASTMTAESLAVGLLPSLLTPLGPLADDRRLADVARSDRLPELDFEFPLAGGDDAHTTVTLGQLAPLLLTHLAAEDPLAGYPALLTHPALAEQTLRGYLTGSIDAVLRVHDTDGEPRYLVVDYKTNWLGDFNGEPLLLAPYAPPLLAEAMMQAHYPLQAMLYSVAVHRMLRWRQPGYDPDRHLGGVLYLFVRGMAGPDTPVVDGVPAGVFSWAPPASLVVALSDLLDGQLAPNLAPTPPPVPDPLANGKLVR